MASAMSEFYSGIKLFGELISTVVNSFLLTVVYVIGVGGTSVIGKILGKKFLDYELSGSSGGTYWEELDLGKKKMEDYYRQF